MEKRTDPTPREAEGRPFWGMTDSSVPGEILLSPGPGKMQMLWIRGGTGRILMGQNCWGLQKGNLLFLHQGPVCYLQAGKEPLAFTSFSLEDKGDEFPVLFRIDPGGDRELLLEELRRICAGSRAGPPNPRLNAFLDWIRVSAASPPSKRHPENVRSKALKQLMDTRFLEDLRLGRCAEELHMNRYGLCRDFKACYGLSPIEYLINLRIQEACRLLRETPKSVAEIGSAVGMDNTSYFIRTFKKRVGHTPASYRADSFPICVK